MQILIDDLYLVIGLDVAGSDLALAGRVNINGLHAVAVHFRDDPLHVQNDLGDIFLNAGDRREFVLHARDFDGGRGSAGQRGKQDSSQRVTQGRAVASFQRLNNKHAMGRIFGRVNTLDSRLVNFYHLLIPSLLMCKANALPCKTAYQ